LIGYHWQTFSAKSKIGKQGQEPTLKGSTLAVALLTNIRLGWKSLPLWKDRVLPNGLWHIGSEDAAPIYVQT